MGVQGAKEVLDVAFDDCGGPKSVSAIVAVDCTAGSELSCEFFNKSELGREQLSETIGEVLVDSGASAATDSTAAVF